MSYSMLVVALFAVVSLSSAIQQHALVRFYSDFAQLYRPTPKPMSYSSQQSMPSSSSSQQSMSSSSMSSPKRYQFLFTEQEWSYIHEESLSLLYSDVIERSIVFHSMPNFEIEGTRYFYRRDPKQMESIEIELINVRDRLFREVKRHNHYFYLKSFDDLEYLIEPKAPFYEVNFMFNTTSSSSSSSSMSNDINTQVPLLSYIDRSFKWSPRYELDLPMTGTSKKPEMIAYADIENDGEKSIIIQRAELNAGDVKLTDKSTTFVRVEQAYGSPFTSGYSSMTAARFVESLGEQASGTFVYQLNTPSALTLPPRSTTSINFFEPHVSVDSYLCYSSSFSTFNTKGKLAKAYNVTSLDSYVPSGRLMLREQGRFMGELNLPNLAVGETYKMLFGYDAEVFYRRQVNILKGDEDSETIVYGIQIMFENHKLSRDILVDFTESFQNYKYFEVNNISTGMGSDKLVDLVLYGTDLQGRMMLKRQGGQKLIKFEVTIYKDKPTAMMRQQQQQQQQ